MPTALITGASAGLGRAFAAALARRHWHLVIDARGEDRLLTTAAALRELTTVDAISGSVTDPAHRDELVDTVRRSGRLDLLVNNASDLGGSPQPALRELTAERFAQIILTNVTAPLQLTRALVTTLATADGAVLNISSDAAAEHYEGWGGYGASKAALDHLTGTFAVEHPQISFYAVDPGDMRTEMHQSAFPGEDISDRPDPATVVPALLRLLDRRPPSGRYRAGEIPTAFATTDRVAS